MVSTRIDWVREHCRLLRAIAAEFARTRPFDGLTIGTGIHLEAKTVALLLTLRDGGARLVSTGNLNTTQPDAVSRLRAEGVTVIGGPTKDSQLHATYLDEVLAAEPDLILDNGGDLFARYLDRPYDGLVGGTEETTSGRMRLEPLRDRLRRPILVINDSPIKQFAENEHAVGQSALESYLRMTLFPGTSTRRSLAATWIASTRRGLGDRAARCGPADPGSRCRPGGWRRSKHDPGNGPPGSCWHPAGQPLIPVSGQGSHHALARYRESDRADQEEQDGPGS